MKRIALYVNYYIDQHTERHSELETCLMHNIMTDFDEVHLITTPQHRKEMSLRGATHAHFHQADHRPSVDEYIELANENNDGDTVVVICNSDIFFQDDAVKLLKEYPWDKVKTFMGLSRHDVTPLGDHALLDRRDSQDAFVWHGKCNITGMECPLGFPGVDNRFMRKASEAGYKVLNPARDIKALHLHNVKINNYRDANNNVKGDQICPEPYYFVAPHHL